MCVATHFHTFYLVTQIQDHCHLTFSNSFISQRNQTNFIALLTQQLAKLKKVCIYIDDN